MEEKLLTVSEMAGRLSVPNSWLYQRTRLRGKEQIPLRRVGKYIRFYESEVMDWLEQQNGRNMA